MALTTGDTLQNRYRIVSPLARGGMAAIYRAWHLALNAPVAIKEMTPQPGLDPQTLAQLRQQFQQEAAVLARLDHPNLVRVTDFFEEGDNTYLVMDMVAGESLDDRVERCGALPEDGVLAWADQLLDALAYCHGQGVIHRDVKPHNVIIRPERQAPAGGGGASGDAVLIDFGLVKLWDPDDPRTKTAMQGMGTPEYAPPEQYDAGAGHTDPRSDIYGLGATLYHLLTGQAPPTATQRMVNPATLKPPRALNPDLSIHAEQAVLRALEPQPDHRFQSAQEMAAALRGEGHAWSGEAPTSPYPAGTPPAGRQAAPSQQRIPGWAKVLGGIVLGGMAFLVLVIGLVIAGWPTAPASSQAPTVPRSVAAVTATPLSPTPTPVGVVEDDLLVRFGDFAELVGYRLPAAEVTTDRPLQLTLNWRALDKQNPADYVVFTHLRLDDGSVIAQHDGPPAGGARPMSEWTPGETIEDHHPMTFAPGLSYTGPATIVVGLYDPNTSERVPTDAGSDHVILPITIRIVAGN